MGDTEWEDILIANGIIQPKEKKVEEVEEIVEKSRDEKFAELEDNDDLDELDEDDERAFQMYRQQRLAEMSMANSLPTFGEVIEITKKDWLEQVNQAGQDIWVVVHVYRTGDVPCALINQHFTNLARKFPRVKFIKSLVSVCIPNFPEENLPALFFYQNGDLKKQFFGALSLGSNNITQDTLEWIISQVGAVKTDLEHDPRSGKQSSKSSKMYSRLDD